LRVLLYAAANIPEKKVQRINKSKLMEKTNEQTVKQSPTRLSPQELEFMVFTKYQKQGIAKTQDEIQEEVLELMKLQK
jgi:hypothetical protein